LESKKWNSVEEDSMENLVTECCHTTQHKKQINHSPPTSNIHVQKKEKKRKKKASDHIHEK